MDIIYLGDRVRRKEGDWRGYENHELGTKQVRERKW